MCNFNYLELGLFKVIQGQRSWCQSEAHWWFPIWPPLCLTLYLLRHSRYLVCQFCDLVLRQFKVIQAQRWRCQSIAQEWFHGRLPLISSWYLSQFSRYLTLNYFWLRLSIGRKLTSELKWKKIDTHAHKSLPVAPLKEIVLALGKMNLRTKFDWNQTTNESAIVDSSLKVS